ncbi:MAG TPA: hypothetical protein DD979_07670 [Gammaproteobacteria bacterium]|jgi:hypothetical protein|nr:hypothetical protein [Gammaproteobacteria bacterium]
MTNFAIPKKIEVQQMLGMLYDNEISVEDAEPIAAQEDPKAMVAVYVDDNDVPVTACTCDFNFTAYAGGALTKIPQGGAAEMAETGEFSQMIMGNFYEVMNICSRLFMNSQTPHLRLEKTYPKLDDAPGEVTTIFTEAASNVGFKVNIDGYGEGQLSFVSR